MKVAATSWPATIIVFQIAVTLCQLIIAREGNITNFEFVESSTLTNNESDVTTTTSIPLNSSIPSDPISCNCGTLERHHASGKIVGGTPAHLGRNQIWPWFATLIHLSRPTIAHCGASLISPRYLISAAHCIIPMLQVGLRNFRVKLGYNDLSYDGSFKNSSSSIEEMKVFDVGIESALVHPKFEQVFPYHYDIGLVKLSDPVTCSNHIRPICLPTHDYSHLLNTSVEAITVGFGKTGINENYSKILLQIELQLVGNDKCLETFSNLSYQGPAILDNMLCAWAQGKDTCVGDSGGPLFVFNEDKENGSTKGQYEQIGITSWGVGCANDLFPGVYTKLEHYTDWITSIANT